MNRSLAPIFLLAESILTRLYHHVKSGLGILTCLLLMFTTSASAQSQIGGPYKADSNTVLLMDFDGDYQNEVNATAEPDTFGKVSLVQMDSAGVFGHQLRLHNERQENRSHLQVPDTSSLDLAGSWTMEAWVNIFSLCQTQTCWNRNPRILFKPGDPHTSQYYYSNYFFNIFPTQRDFATGYYSREADTWIEIRSPNNLIRIGEWFHITFIRDTAKKVIVQMIHQNAADHSRLPGLDEDSLEMIHFESFDYEQAGQTGVPQTSGQPLFIGTSPQNDTLFAGLDGFLDEIRISNTVRTFNVPPAISGVTELENQSAHQNYPIGATIHTVGDNQVRSATLHYRVDQESWQEIEMQEGAESRYMTTIPTQPAGSRIEYWIEAESEDGKQAVQPNRALSDSTYYNFGVWERYSEILKMEFDGVPGPPTNQQPYNTTITLHGDTKPDYGSGDEGDGDYALSFDASESQWAELGSPFLGLSEFALSFKFFAADSVPPTDTRLLAKGPADALYLSNYQVYFDPNGALRPSIYMKNNSLSPCGEFASRCLVMDDSEDGRVQADTWYEVQMGIRAPDTTDTTITRGVVFARLIHNRSDTVVAENLYETDAGATPDNHSLRIGGIADDYGGPPYFNGNIDDLSLYNYIPNRFLPDSVHTGSDPQTELPSKVKLQQNYPNPFNPTTRISYNLPRTMNITLTVYNLVGRKVATLVDGRRRAGNHTVSFNGQHLASGLYFYRLQTPTTNLTRKMLLVK